MMHPDLSNLPNDYYYYRLHHDEQVAEADRRRLARQARRATTPVRRWRR
jgi:hypothetical protein